VPTRLSGRSAHPPQAKAPPVPRPFVAARRPSDGLPPTVGGAFARGHGLRPLAVASVAAHFVYTVLPDCADIVRASCGRRGVEPAGLDRHGADLARAVLQVAAGPAAVSLVDWSVAVAA